jgi:hypothetical protein
MRGAALRTLCQMCNELVPLLATVQGIPQHFDTDQRLPVILSRSTTLLTNVLGRIADLHCDAVV